MQYWCINKIMLNNNLYYFSLPNSKLVTSPRCLQQNPVTLSLGTCRKGIKMNFSTPTLASL